MDRRLYDEAEPYRIPYRLPVSWHSHPFLLDLPALGMAILIFQA